MDEERKPISPVMIIIALGVIAAMLFPVFQVFVNTERSRRIAGNAFGFVLVVMCALALFNVARVWLKPGRSDGEDQR